MSFVFLTRILLIDKIALTASQKAKALTIRLRSSDNRSE